MARSNAERRLTALLANEEYGPKLARLRGDDERRVLSLIEQNRGKEARAEINRLDEARREKRRAKSLSTEEKRERAVTNILRQEPRANRNNVTMRVFLMDDDDLAFAAVASKDDLHRRARERPAYHHPRTGDEINAFWYH